MFEAMFMNQAAKKRRTVMGGALFVNLDTKAFFQRAFDADQLEAMRAEMAEGLPEGTSAPVETASASCSSASPASHSYVMSTQLPVGSWEVRVVELDDAANSVCVSLSAAYREGDAPAEDEEGKRMRASLRLERTFLLPADAKLEGVEVDLDESGRLVRLTCPKTASTAAPPSDVLEPAPMDVEPSAAMDWTEEEATLEPVPAQRQFAHSNPPPASRGSRLPSIEEEAPNAAKATASAFQFEAMPAAASLAASSAATTAAASMRKKKAAKKGSSAKPEGLRPGFLNNPKPKAAVTTAATAADTAAPAAAASTPRPSEPMAEVVETEAASTTAQSAKKAAKEHKRDKSPTSIVDDAIRAQMDELVGGV